jgi:hypothetical protein
MLRLISSSRSALVGAAMAALVGCESSPTAPARATARPSFAVTDNVRDLPFAFNVRGCNERVRVTGTFHLLASFTLSPSGNETDRFHINATGTGIGLTSGASYRFNDPINLTAHFRDGVRQVESQVETLTLIGEGSVPNTKIRARFQFAMNANGDTTVEIDQTETICQ